MSEKKELQYFNIGKSYGGNQRWMMDPWMHVGGCAALTTCDALIYFSLYKEKPHLCPYKGDSMTKHQYRKFGMSVRPYLQPRQSGIKDIDTYIQGVKIYLEDIGEDTITVSGIEGIELYETAEEAIKEKIDVGIPVPYLMLKHYNKKFDFFEWHWFLVIGYEIREDGFYIKAATYGKSYWLSLRELWDTGFEEKGGIILFSILK